LVSTSTVDVSPRQSVFGIAAPGPGGHAGDHEHGGQGHHGYDVAVMQRVYDLIFNPAATAVVAASGTRATRSVQFTAKMFTE